MPAGQYLLGTKEYDKQYRAKNKERLARKRREYHLKTLYNLSQEDYLLLYTKQNQSCAICKKELVHNSKSCHIDHCHVTNKVRGLLCSHCNTALGLSKESISTLENMIIYLN